MGMATLKAVVRQGRVVVEDRVDYPEGTELELEVVDAENAFDENDLDEEDQAALDSSIARGLEEMRQGKGRPLEEFIAELRSRGQGRGARPAPLQYRRHDAPPCSTGHARDVSKAQVQR